MTPSRGLLLVGTHRRAHRADPADIAFGIYVFEYRIAAGRMSIRALGMRASLQPGWIAAHPNGRVAYAVNEVERIGATHGGCVTAYRVEPATGTLTELNSRPTAALPCHCTVDETGTLLLLATFGGGSVHLFALENDGRIGPELVRHMHQGASVHPRRQRAPHAHAVHVAPGNRFVLVPDLGTDRLEVYALDAAAGSLQPLAHGGIRLPPGAGPRHATFDECGDHVYLVNEISASITVLAFDREHGSLRARQTADLLPADFAGLRSGAAIALHPGGRFLYASTRSHGSSGEPPVRGLDSLVWFEISPSDASIRFCGRVPAGGEIPRSLAIEPGGRFLVMGHQASGRLEVFGLDPLLGTPVAADQAVTVPVPVCVCLLPQP
ncbi:MAG: lactonase family protein [Gammaproteobacteria bacterium]|nr:lactonase family protein [Gammaproteobacteria bacterium]